MIMLTRAVVLAAGSGRRMASDIPKVLVPLAGTPLLIRLLTSIVAAGIDAEPVIVVGENKLLIERALNDHGVRVRYAVQAKPLGTGHAVRAAQAACAGAERIVVLYGDHPLVSPATIRALCDAYVAGSGPVALATAIAPDFSGVHAPFADFGRIIRNDAGRIMKIVEKKDTTPHELAVREVNPAYFCFSAAWLWEKLAMLTNENAQKEYYLGDTLQAAIREGYTIASVAISPHEALGVNTPEHLRAAELLLGSIS